MVVSSYDEIAEWYDEYVSAGALLDDPFYPMVEKLIGPVSGLRVCDLACGQGRVARRLADRGARVIGIDSSGKLLAIAGRYEREEPHGIAYLRDDAQTLAAVRGTAFDGVVCHMALMDIPDLAATLRAVARVLRPGGWFVFSVLHPCYHTSTSGEVAIADGALRRLISAYFVEGHWRSTERVGPPGKVGAYHRMLSTYLNELANLGLMLERAAEPRANAGLARSRPIWREVPAVLVARCRKVERAAHGYQTPITAADHLR